MFAKSRVAVVVSFLMAGLLAGCSSSDKSSPPQNMLVYVQANQGDTQDAYIRTAVIANNGLLDTETDGRVKAGKVLVAREGQTALRVARTQMHYFQLVGRQAQADRNQPASSARCQWVEGCAAGVKFGERLIAHYNWRATTFGLGADEHIVVTPMTEMAAALAEQWVYDETNKEWLSSGYYSPQSIVQASSQVSKLFELDNINILYQAPADLTRITALNAADLAAKDQLRYGALVAAWMHLEEQNPGFTEKAVAEFINGDNVNPAQLLEKNKEDELERALTLNMLYQAAAGNLEQLAKSNAGAIQTLINEVAGELKDAYLLAGNYTNVEPQPLETLLGNAENADYKLGLGQAKIFVDEINELSSTFFDSAYRDRLKQYKAKLDALSSKNKATFEEMLTTVITNEKKLRDACPALKEGCAITENGIKYQLQSHVKGALYMQLNISGTMQEADLTLDVKNKTNADGEITDKSYLRVYFGKDKLDELLAGGSVAAATPLAYELHWADFTLYDHQEKFAEQTGELDIFYRGVKGPETESVHYNIEKVLLNSKLSDEINDKGEKDKDIASLFIAAQSTNAASFYGDKKFAELSFDAFFKPSSENLEDEDELIEYAFGKETLSGQDVEYFDLYVANGEATRYRFYPDVKRADSNDINSNGDFLEKITTHDMSICQLEATANGEWKISGTCTPKQRFYERRDVQRTLNTLWKTGAFSYINVAGKGDYFVKWPATENTVNGCFELDELASSGQLSGELLAEEVLGLNSLRFTSEILLDKQPKTLFDMKMYKPTNDRVNLTFALSNNYTGLSGDEVVIGQGKDMNRILFSYNTDSAFARNGNVSFYKGGVSLKNELGKEEKVDGEFFFGFNQPYANLPHKYTIGPDGDETVCIVENEPAKRDVGAEKPKFSLAFGGVVYGTVEHKSTGWEARFIDGSTKNMDGFNELLNMTFDFLK